MGIDDLLVQRGTLEIGTRVPSDTGGEAPTVWATVASAVPCYVRAARVPADLRPGEVELITHIAYTRPIAAITADPARPWALVVDGHRHLLIDRQDATARGHHWEIRARRLT